MKCPGCKRPDAKKLIIGFRKITVEGKDKVLRVQGCENCFRMRFEPHVYSGRKCWTGDEVYGREKCREMNLEFERRTIESEPGIVLRGPADFGRRRR